MINKQDLIDRFSLVEHREGGYFAETYRSTATMPTERQGIDRNIITSIYYLLTDDRPIGYFHRNLSPIIHYFHAGSPLTYLLLSPDGELEKIKLGNAIDRGETMQLIVPSGYWKATILEAGEYGLLGEAVAPGFDYRDNELATADYFQATFPHLWEELKDYVKQ